MTTHNTQHNTTQHRNTARACRDALQHSQTLPGQCHGDFSTRGGVQGIRGDCARAADTHRASDGHPRCVRVLLSCRGVTRFRLRAHGAVRCVHA